MTDLGSFYGDNWVLLGINITAAVLLTYAVASFTFNRRLAEIAEDVSDLQAAWDEESEYDYEDDWQPTTVIPAVPRGSYYEAGTGSYAVLAELGRAITPTEVLMPTRAPYVEQWEDRTRTTGLAHAGYGPQVTYRPTVPVVPGPPAPRHAAPDEVTEERVWHSHLLTATQEWSVISPRELVNA